MHLLFVCLLRCCYSVSHSKVQTARFTVSNYSASCENIKCPAGKVTALMVVLKSALRIIKSHKLQLPNVVTFLVQTGSTGAEAENIICIARSDPSKKCIMVPNPYFGDLYKWQKQQDQVVRQNWAWPMKHPVAFYRGGCAASAESRYSLMSLQSPLLEVGWLTKTDQSCLQKFVSSKEELKVHLLKRKPPLPERKFTEYQYLLNMPGSTKGSYSRHMNFIWNKASVVLLWENSAVEWYYDALIENVTHITVNEHTLLPKLKEMNAWPSSRLLELASNAYKVYVEKLTSDAIALRWYHVLLRIQRLSGSGNSSAILRLWCIVPPFLSIILVPNCHVCSRALGYWFDITRKWK